MRRLKAADMAADVAAIMIEKMVGARSGEDSAALLGAYLKWVCKV